MALGGFGAAVLLARQFQGRWFHTVPAPLSELHPYVKANARPLSQLAFYLGGVLHASDLARDALREGTPSPTATSTPSSPTTPPFTAWTTTA